MADDAMAGSTMMLSSAVGAGDAEQRRLFDDDDDIGRQRQFEEAIEVLLERGHHRLVQRVHLILQQSQLYEAMRVLHDDDEEEDAVADEFRRLLNQSVLDFHFAGYSHDDIFHVLPILVLIAARRTAGFRDHVVSPSSSHSAGVLFEYPEEQDQFDEAMRALAERGRDDVVHLVRRCLEQRHDYVEAMRVDHHHHGDGGGMADDRLVGELRRHLRDHVLRLLFVGYEEHAVSDLFHVIVLLAIREAAGFRDRDSETTTHHQSSSHSNGGGGGGFGAVPAPAAAVARLEKRRFHAGGDGNAAEGCCVCFEDFVDGEEVSVMPCPLRGHEFHPSCIAKWLAISNLCPLCRHGLDGGARPASSSMVAEPDRVAEESRAPRHGTTVETRRRSTRQGRPNVRTSGPEWNRPGPYLR